MIWPFTKKESKKEKKKDSKPLIKRLQEDTPEDSTDLRAKEILKKSADACEVSGILDDEAMKKLQEAKKKTDTMRRRVKVNAENISSVLEGDEHETVQDRALRELREFEERERARA